MDTTVGRWIALALLAALTMATVVGQAALAYGLLG